MNTSETQKNQKTSTEKNLLSTQVFQCIIYITHKCALLQGVFLKWTNFNAKEKILLNYIAFHVIEKSQIELYAPIIQGFSYWNALQDTEGACGFHGNPLDFKFDIEEEKRIFHIILIIDKIVSNIAIRSDLCEEIKHFNIKTLTSHSSNSVTKGCGDNQL